MLMRMPRAPSIAPASSSGEAMGLAPPPSCVARRGGGGAHDGITHACHDGLHICEVAVDDGREW